MIGSEQLEWAQASTVGDLLLRAAVAGPERTALVFADVRLTYGELAEAAIGAAQGLAGLGIGRGDTVGLLMSNCPEFVTTFFGAQLLGAVVLPLNTRFRERELAHVVGQADVKVLVVGDAAAEEVDLLGRLCATFPALEGAADPRALELAPAPALRSVVVFGGAVSGTGLLTAADMTAAGTPVGRQEVLRRRGLVGVRDPALMLFTSGTTAMPKGCLLSHEAVVRGWIAVGRRLAIVADDRVYDPLPLFHMGGIGPMLFTFERGGTVLNQRHFEPSAGLDLIERERATFLYTMFPPVTIGLMRDPSFAERDLSSVRALMNVAPMETLSTISRAFAPAAHMQGPFGMTEAGGAITCNDITAPVAELQSTGPPLPGMEVKVVDPVTGAEVPVGKEGLLLVRGVGLFEGYYGDPGATAATVDAAGWLHSGDLGRIDERGYVVYVGRSKEMLKVGGENVAPSEIEAHLSTHPAVKLVQVVGLPDDRLDEVPAAVIEVAPGAQLTADEVIAYCRGKIASFKVPRHVSFVTQWPMSATKIQKHRVREDLLERIATERKASTA
jgi:fatty-acyl-CoA synthase